MTDKLRQRTVVTVLICRIYVILWHVAHIYVSMYAALSAAAQPNMHVAIEGAATKSRNMLQVV